MKKGVLLIAALVGPGLAPASHDTMVEPTQASALRWPKVQPKGRPYFSTT